MAADWDLQVEGRSVETKDDLLRWLRVAPGAPVTAQVAALTGFLSMNRRTIPEPLYGELLAFLGPWEHQ